MEEKSKLFLKYFTLYMNLLNDCSEDASTEDKVVSDGAHRKRASSNLTSLRTCTVTAMSNLLNANIDSGLMHSVGKLLIPVHVFQWLLTVHGWHC